MKVKIKATGFGATALTNGTILHFDKSEADKPKAQRDMRKLEAEVELVDAQRIKELGWGDFADKAGAEAAEEGERAELGDAVQQLEQAPEPEKGKPSQKAPPADRDDPSAQVKRAAAARPKRPAELAKAAAKAAAKASGEDGQAPAGDAQGDGSGGADAESGADVGGDPEAGPK